MIMWLFFKSGIEENCNWEEAREVYESDTAGLNIFWREYTAPPTTEPPPPLFDPESRIGSDESPAESNVSTVVIIVVSVIFLILFIVLLVFFCLRRKKKREKEQSQPFLDPNSVNRHVEIGSSFSEYQVKQTTDGVVHR